MYCAYTHTHLHKYTHTHQHIYIYKHAQKDNYNRVIVEQHVEPHHKATYCTQYAPVSTPDLLCLICNNKQKYKVMARSEFEAFNEVRSTVTSRRYSKPAAFTPKQISPILARFYNLISSNIKSGDFVVNAYTDIGQVDERFMRVLYLNYLLNI